QARLRRVDRPPRRPRRLRGVARSAPPARLGRVRQTALRRPRTGPRVPGPLYPPRGALQRAAPQPRRRPGALPLEGLRRRRPRQGDGAGGGGVHPPLPAPCRPRRLRAHPPLRPPRQPHPPPAAPPTPPPLAACVLQPRPARPRPHPVPCPVALAARRPPP